MRPTPTVSRRWLVIVDRARPDLYAWLRRQLGTHADVLLDRRTEPGAAHDERRQPLSPAAATFWTQCGYLVVPRQPSASEMPRMSTPAFIAAMAAQLGAPTVRTAGSTRAS
jgi:hypothetical protein